MEKIRIHTSTIDNQKFEGWGTALCWWGHILGNWKDEDKINTICDLLFDPIKGIGMNIVRYNFGGCQEDTDTSRFRPGADISTFMRDDHHYDWSMDEGQVKILKKSMERGVDIKEAFLNSPPACWTLSGYTSGNVNGGNNLDENYKKELIQYIVTLLKHFKEEGIHFHCISPFNEPSSFWWTSDNIQEGCHYSVALQSELVVMLRQALDEEGLQDIIISGPEGWSTVETITMYLDYTKEAKEALEQVNTHVYGVDDRSRQVLGKLVHKDGKRLWMSEVTHSAEGNLNHEGIQTGIELAEIIIKDLKYLQPSAWVYWQAVEDQRENHNFGFIHAPFLEEESYTILKNYYCMGQFSKFIRPGCQIIAVEQDNCIAAVNDEECVVVIVNTSMEEKVYQLQVDIDNITCCEQIVTSKEQSMESYSLDANALQALSIQPRSVNTIRILK